MSQRISKPHALSIFLLVAASSLSSFVYSADADGKAEKSLIPEAVVTAVINSPRLATFLHPDAPDRVPLILSDEHVDAGMKLIKFSHPVLILPEKEIGSKPHLRFLEYRLDGENAKVIFEYQVEGLNADFDLSQGKKGEWKITKEVITEG